MFDLTASQLGFDPHDVLSELRRAGHRPNQIVTTPFAEWLDRSRREWWASEGEPERPRHPDVRFLQHHRASDGECSTYADQSATGAMTTPARGYTKEQWAEMNSDDQRAARQRQFDADAEEQREWEARARREYDERRVSDASA